MDWDTRDAMLVEWRAWQSVVAELRELDIDINEQEPLAATLVEWGELLVALRVEQDSDVRAQALDRAHQKRRIALKHQASLTD